MKVRLTRVRHPTESDEREFAREIIRRVRAGEPLPRAGRGASKECWKSVVYFFRAGPFVKIGRAEDLNGRRKELQTGCPYKLVCVGWVEGGHKEKWAHSRLAKHRLKGSDLNERGEWFFWNDEVEETLRIWARRNGNLREPGYKKAPTLQRPVTREERFAALDKMPSLLP